MSNELLKEELSITISRADIEVETADSLQKAFEPFYEKTQSWMDKAKELVVTDASQTEAMATAREARLALKGIRGDVEKIHKTLKADALKKGQLLDLIKRTLIQRIEPIEEHLQTQEDFVKIAEKNRLDAVENARVSELGQYVENVTYYQLRDMPEEQYKQLLAGCIQGKKEREAVAKKEEEDRLAKIEADRLEQERILAENERLRLEAKAKEEEMLAIQKKADEEREKQREAQKAKDKLILDRNSLFFKIGYNYPLDDLGEITKEAFEVIFQREKAAFAAREQEKADKEAENKRLQTELKERQDRDAAVERERIQAEKAKQAAERKAAKSSDMEKLLKLASEIEAIKIPVLKDATATEISARAAKMLLEIVEFIKNQSENL